MTTHHLNIPAPKGGDIHPYHIELLTGASALCLFRKQIFQEKTTHYIVWIPAATGVCAVNDQAYDLIGDCLLLLNASQITQFYMSGINRCIVCSFRPDFSLQGNKSLILLRGKLQSDAHGFCTLIEPEMGVKINNILSLILSEFAQPIADCAELLGHYLAIYFHYVCRSFRMNDETIRFSRNDEILKEFTKLVERDFRVKKMVGDYAEAIAVSPNHLNEVIKKMTGNSARHHIRQRIALEAQREAAYSNMCMKNIAYNLGFLDLAHFSKFFKSTTGVSFSDYKNSFTALQVA